MRVDEQFMKEVGLSDMPDAERKAFMEHAEEELEVRVGQHIGMRLSDAQMWEFEQIADDDEAARWLELNAPDFRETVRQVYEAFKSELLEEKAKILAA